MKSFFQIRLSGTLFLAWLQLAFLTTALHSLIAAQGPISAVQEALRREQVFFGEATGVVDEPTREALKRFQVRRGLPVTGQIDGDTLQALEGSREAGRPVVRSLAPKGTEDATTAVTVEKDRAFLQSLQKEEAKGVLMATPAPVASAELPPPASEMESPRGQGPVAEKEVPPEPPPIVAEAPRVEATPIQKAPRPAVPASRKSEPLVIAPGHRVVEVEEDPFDPRGGRVIRSTTTTVGVDGRTRIYETRTRTFANTPPPIIIRRAEPVERDKEGFFHRLFKGRHHDENDDD